MVTFMKVVLGLILGALVGAFGVGGLIQLLSTNTHDKSVEVAMTGAFVGGPFGAVCGVLVALFWPKRPSAPTPDR